MKTTQHTWNDLLLLGVASLLVGALPAQSTGYSDRFDSSGINGRVFGLGTWNGQLYAGGPFVFQTGGGPAKRLARFDGYDWQEVGGGVDGPVRAITSYGGELVVAGAFSRAGNVAANSIASWNGTRWKALGQGLTRGLVAEVFALAVFRGELYAGGWFDSAGGRSIDTIARWDGTRWQAVGAGLGGPTSRKVLSLHVDGATLYAGGEFDAAGGRPARNVATWDGARWQSLGSGLGAAAGDGVHALATFQGHVYAGGNFRNAGTTSTLKIARWNGRSWGPVGLGIPDSSISVQVDALEVFGGELWVCGSFSEVDAASRGQGLFSQGMARWDGSRWRSAGGLFRNAFGGQTYGIAACSHASKLFVAGDFDHAGRSLDHASNVVSNDIVAWNGTAFEAVGQGLGVSPGAKKSVRWNGSTWTIGGLYAGNVVSPRIARFDGARWNIVGPLDPRSDIQDAVVFRGSLHVLGTVKLVKGPTLSGVVRFDGSKWTSLGGPTGGVMAIHRGELYVGGLGSVQRLGSSGWVRLPGIFGQVEAMQSFQGELYLGGSNLGTSSAVNLLKWNGSTFATVGSGTDGSVKALHEHGGELWVGGSFSVAGGVNSPRLVRWNGTRFLSFPQALSGTSVRALATLGTALFLSGDLGVIRGTRTTLARWDSGMLDPLAGGPNSAPTHLLADGPTGTLWVSGGFTRSGPATARGIAIWHERPRWIDLGQSLPGSRGAPFLEVFGSLAAPGTLAMRVHGLGQGDPLAVVVGAQAWNLPVLGGVLVPRPDIVIAGLMADTHGHSSLDVPVPPGLASGSTIYVQAWSAETRAQRLTASNAVLGRR